jgi:5-methylcytosine-specific restriction endonuclease McrA
MMNKVSSDGRKVCMKCNIELPVSDFHVYHKIEGNPPKSRCKSCERLIGREYAKTEKGKEACSRAHSKYDVTNKGIVARRRSAINAYRRNGGNKWHDRWAQTDEGKKWVAEYRKSAAYKASVEKYMQSSKHKEYIESGRHREMSRRYWLSDKGKERTRRGSYMRRLVETGLSNVFTAEDWQKVKEQYKNCCVYCGEKKPLTRDHLIPLSKGGQSVKENIVPACLSCNSRKKDKPVLLQLLAMCEIKGDK